MKSKKTIRILSIDGGGIFGIIPLCILRSIEDWMEKPISQLFDYVGGTSSGGIIALSLMCPNKKGGALYSAEESLQLFQKKSHLIFQKSLAQKIFSWIPILKKIYTIFFPKYSETGGQKVYKEIFGNTTLSKALGNTFVSAYELKNSGPCLRIFNSQKTKKAIRSGGSDFLMRDIAFATSAAPTLFPPQRIWCLRPLSSPKKSPYVFIDGAVAMNNMSLFLYAHARKKHPHCSIHILSLGISHKPINYESIDSQKMGWISWIKKITCLISQPQISCYQIILKKLIRRSPHQDTYERIQPAYDPSLKEFDNASSQHILKISSLAEKTVLKNLDRLKLFFRK